MRFQFIVATILATSTSAFAADLTPQIAEPIAPVVTYDWTGFYAGLSAGYAHANAKVTDISPGVARGPFSYSSDGGIGSGQVGYNWQINSFVLGAEADIGYMGSDGKGIIGSTNAGSHQDLTLDGGLYGDVTARVGYAFGPALIYAKGGFAFFNGEARQTTTNPGYATTGTDTFTGWTIGGGVEYMIMQNLSVKVEYQHFDFGTQSGFQTALVADPPTPAGFRFRNETDLTADAVKIGMNYRF
jgi:outer membrane immunogenic protein